MSAICSHETSSGAILTSAAMPRLEGRAAVSLWPAVRCEPATILRGGASRLLRTGSEIVSGNDGQR
jgi:hypothetical protein